MNSWEDIYQVYQTELIPLIAEMHAYIEKDYREHNKDVADLFKIIAENSSSRNLSEEAAYQAVWLITKIKIAAYSFIVAEIKKNLENFDRRCKLNQREFVGIEQEYETLKNEINDCLKTIKQKYGRYPKICEDCMFLYERAYNASSRAFKLMAKVSTKSSWIYPYSPFEIFKRPLTWVFSLVVAVLVDCFIRTCPPDWLEYIKNWLCRNNF